ncbi:MAG TPA: phosphate signaling complex protein PhoU [Kouleothrix sp.]|uniref:phosphate signaling complex protein PhoU n=1 Tax=Kouleothrix sp. TaxID=2779161 RepID=UPI002C6276C9|nr:phosphate signaling complex protein PhoU [Kouleothrix sp.]
MRERYLRQLKVVHDDLLRMGSRVEHALANAMRALDKWDTSMAQMVILGDKEIDQARDSIEEAILELLATQQPVLATDLRTLNATIAIAGELERAGDYAKAIAKRVGRCLKAPGLIETPPALHRMGGLAQGMLNTCLDAFIRLDVGLARSLAAEDERVDELEDQVVADLMNIARQGADKLDCAICLIDIAHTLERLADRTTNIAERVVFIATNETEQLNA